MAYSHTFMAPCHQADSRVSWYTGKSSHQELRSLEECGHSLLLAWVTLGKPLTLLTWFSDFKMGVLAPSSTSPGCAAGSGRRIPQSSHFAASHRVICLHATAPLATPDNPGGVTKSGAQTHLESWSGQTTTQGWLQSQWTVYSTISLPITRTFWRLWQTTHKNGQMLSTRTDLLNYYWTKLYCIWLHMH